MGGDATQLGARRQAHLNDLRLPKLSTESWSAVASEDELAFFRAFGKIRWQSGIDAGRIAVSL